MIDAGSADGGTRLHLIDVGGTGFGFTPSALSIHVGDTVRWVFAAGPHNVVSGSNCTADEQFCYPSNTNCSSAPTASQGVSYEVTFGQAGAYPYFCAPHCAFGMTGTVTVQ